MINAKGETIYTSAEIAYELGISTATVNAVGKRLFGGVRIPHWTLNCKDCKWRLNDGYCLIPKGCRQIVADEHYCSRGERWADNAE